MRSDANSAGSRTSMSTIVCVQKARDLGGVEGFNGRFGVGHGLLLLRVGRRACAQWVYRTVDKSRRPGLGLGRQ